MTTPEVAKDLFAEAQAAFAPVVGAPNNDDVKHLNEAFINALQSIDIPGGAINLSDILLTNEEHKAKHGDGSTFARMEVPLPAYDDSIAANANNAVRAKAERVWTAKIELQRLIKTFERAGRAFLVAVVEDTWLLPLKEEATFYNKVPSETFSCASRAAAVASRLPSSSPSSQPPSDGGSRTHVSPSTLIVLRTHRINRSE